MDLGNPSVVSRLFYSFPYERMRFVLNGNDLSYLDVRSLHRDYLSAEIYNILLNGHFSGIEPFRA